MEYPAGLVPAGYFSYFRHSDESDLCASILCLDEPLRISRVLSRNNLFGPAVVDIKHHFVRVHYHEHLPSFGSVQIIS